MTEDLQFCDYHSHSGMLEMNQPKWLISVDRIWYPLRTYQNKAVENFTESSVIKLLFQIQEKGFSIPTEIHKSYFINNCIFKIEYRNISKIISGELENPDDQPHRMGWNYHQLHLIREDKTKSLLMSFPSYQNKETIEKDERFNQHGSFHPSCWL